MDGEDILICGSCGEEDIDFEDHCVECGVDICPSCSHCESDSHCEYCGN